MTLLELYEGLVMGEIILTSGLCGEIEWNINSELCIEFSELMCKQKIFDSFYQCDIPIWGDGFDYLSRKGVMTPERETFLLLFAAYKGEL